MDVGHVSSVTLASIKSSKNCMNTSVWELRKNARNSTYSFCRQPVCCARVRSWWFLLGSTLVLLRRIWPTNGNVYRFHSWNQKHVASSFGKNTLGEGTRLPHLLTSHVPPPNISRSLGMIWSNCFSITLHYRKMVPKAIMDYVWKSNSEDSTKLFIHTVIEAIARTVEP